MRDLAVEFGGQAGWTSVVRGVGFAIAAGETVGLVGESGSGKSVTALALMRLIAPPGRIAGGQIVFDGEDLLGLPEARMRAVRGGRMSMVFQDPFSSLNPTMTVGEQVAEVIAAHAGVGRAEARARALELLRAVQIPSAEARMRQYPHQMSGGQRQRVMIAMAFASDPELLIADEPTTALDVTVQAQILALMADFQARTKAAILLITHDMAIVAETCQRVLVMYAGQIVEEGTVEQILTAPRHPYTQGLLASLPRLDEERRDRLATIPGQPPDPASLGPGCAFAPRCAMASAVCRAAAPPRVDVGAGQWARCVEVRIEERG